MPAALEREWRSDLDASIGSVSVFNSLFLANWTYYSGGGHIFNLGTLTMVDCELTDGIAFPAFKNDTGLGGAIRSQGQLTLERVTFANNTAVGGGALYLPGGSSVLTKVRIEGSSEGEIRMVGGTMVGENLDFFDNDGSSGLRVLGGSVTIHGATFRENDGPQGGAVFVGGGTVRLTNITAYRNFAFDHGRGFFVAPNASLYLASSTVTRNFSDIDQLGGGNGGGIYVDESCPGLCALNQVFLRNTTIDENFDFSPDGPATHDCSGELTSQGYNFVGTYSSGTFPPAPSTVTSPAFNREVTPRRADRQQRRAHAVG